MRAFGGYFTHVLESDNNVDEPTVPDSLFHLYACPQEKEKNWFSLR